LAVVEVTRFGDSFLVGLFDDDHCGPRSFFEVGRIRHIKSEASEIHIWPRGVIVKL
jgi:hypothetical protein